MVYQLLRNSTIKASREMWLWVMQTLEHVFRWLSAQHASVLLGMKELRGNLMSGRTKEWSNPVRSKTPG